MLGKNSPNSGNSRNRESAGESSRAVIALVIAGIVSINAGVIYLMSSTSDDTAEIPSVPEAPAHPGIRIDNSPTSSIPTESKAPTSPEPFKRKKKKLHVNPEPFQTIEDPPQ